ncbi:MAG: glycosyltransferase [Clostridia bacterium]|nr:glycosyltransferase [Clostridia bacterium]
MKKLLIVNNNMHIGGVQKALINLLSCIHDRYEVTLLLFHAAGELMKEIPSDVKVITPNSAFRYLGMTAHDTAGHPWRTLCRGFFAAVTKLCGRRAAVKLMGLGQRRLRGYDAAVSYLHNGGDKIFYGGCNDFVLRHVTATARVTVLHCDYARCGADTPTNEAQYARFDRIAACSDGCARSFVSACPSLAHKVMTVRNCHNFEAIRAAAAQAPETLAPDALNIVTVARLGREKGVPRAVEAMASLGDSHGQWRYYVIGDGIERGLLTETIAAHGLENDVTLCGELANPYGYMQAADLLLLPSLSEAAPLVIDEAACLGTPILTTETSSAKDMVADTGFGWVCDNTVDGIAEGLYKLLQTPSLLRDKAQRLSETTFDNAEALRQFATLIDGEGGR